MTYREEMKKAIEEVEEILKEREKKKREREKLEGIDRGMDKSNDKIKPTDSVGERRRKKKKKVKREERNHWSRMERDLKGG